MQTEGYMLWDNTDDNRACIGDYFAFINNTGDEVNIYRISAIRGTRDRVEEWDIPQHQDRGVIELDVNSKVSMTFKSYKEQVGYGVGYIQRGTARVKYPGAPHRDGLRYTHTKRFAVLDIFTL